MSHRHYASMKAAHVAWAGEIPAHWQERRLRSLAKLANSNVDKKSYQGQATVLLCNYTDVYYNERITSDIAFTTATASTSEISRFELRSGDVIITKDSEDPSDIGIPAFVPHAMPGTVCGYHLTIIRSRAELEPEYLYYSIMSHQNRARFYAETPGVTRFGLDQNTIKNITVFLPPRDEQLSIVEWLRSETARIDDLIAKKEGFINLLTEKAVALASSYVTKGIVQQAPTHNSGIDWIGHVPRHWTIARIADLFREVDRPADPKLPVLSVSIHNGVTDKELADEDRDRIVNLSEDRTKYQGVMPGDLVYNMMRAWQGAFGAVTVNGLVSPAYVVAEPKAKFRTKFIELLLRTASGAEEVRRYSKGIADFRMRLYWEHFRTLKLCLPSLVEQDQIIDHIEAETARIGRLVSTTERSIGLLKEYRSALITAAVTGKIDVRATINKKSMRAAA